MVNIQHAHQVLPQVWHLPAFLIDPDGLMQSYRQGQQPWRSEYPNRLLTPWSSNSQIESLLAALPDVITTLTGKHVVPQVGYASLDLSGSQIMMHRLHPDIGAYVQIYLGQEHKDLSSLFCKDELKNSTHATDYADISEFDENELVEVKFKFNHAWLMINNPRCFFGTKIPVASNQVRETVCLHFAAKLPAST